MENTNYSVATSGDLPAIQALLADCHLLTDGIEMLIDHCIVATVDSRIVGTVALEQCGRLALFRSLAVAADCRGLSIGRNLSAKMVSHARMAGVEALYLLTTDAERYFETLGFRHIQRNEAPAEIQRTSQFRSLCPKSAVCMARDIRG
ncbi:MAG: arsenic resistance N-acetyltransferase ArsN2 [Bryobacteraceae bacterium]|jgi:amino-acid N-acetyltransferase